MKCRNSYKVILLLSIFSVIYSKSLFPKNYLDGFTDFNFKSQCSNNEINCQKTAILPFEGDLGESGSEYARLYLGMYTNLNIIERQDLLEIFNEQDLYPDRISNATRAKIRELYGADLLVLGKVWSKKHVSLINLILPWKWLDVCNEDWYILVRMVDAETGQIYSEYYLRDGHSWIEIGLNDTFLSESVERLVDKMSNDGLLVEDIEDDYYKDAFKSTE